MGDFVGTAGRPTPMQDHEIEKMLLDSRRPEEEPIVKLTFEKGEPVTIKEGPFQGYEGTVDELLPEKGMVRVLVTIFGRQAPDRTRRVADRQGRRRLNRTDGALVGFRRWRAHRDAGDDGS